jgi:hypothetical protein
VTVRHQEFVSLPLARDRDAARVLDRMRAEEQFSYTLRRTIPQPEWVIGPRYANIQLRPTKLAPLPPSSLSNQRGALSQRAVQPMSASSFPRSGTPTSMLRTASGTQSESGALRALALAADPHSLAWADGDRPPMESLVCMEKMSAPRFVKCLPLISVMHRVF